ncbi:unnamed protein product [Clonostachys byssicola]|uniref:Hemerythrin-like domain-containing protein n=1 Tax=Clonostachys byssicola TaxID=160290 RepID=A0A9N9Y3F3_9HYPO|nr:unnamed protein product [Clonostachys byssicola]
MAPVYADHPFPLVPTPNYRLKKDGKKPDDFDNCASLMGVIHNTILLGLNSIYLQAPNITAKDQKAFCAYILKWHEFLDLHHKNEELEFFPTVEKLAGEEGIMEPNVEQHHKFEPGINSFISYVKDCQNGKENYDGEKISNMIDEFGNILAGHLADEIPTLLSLRKYGDKMDTLSKVFDEEGAKSMKAMGLGGLCFFFANQDLHYEEDLYADFPPAPDFIKFLCRNVVWWSNTELYKFSSCDRLGNMRPLYAAQ